MKKIVLTSLLLPILLLNLSLKAQEPNVYFYYSPFFVQGTGIYIETYLSFAGNSMCYRLNDDKVFQATAEVTMLFKNADKVVEFRIFKVVSPGLTDTTSIKPDFIHQNRIKIPEGVYNFEMIVKDMNAPDTIKPYRYSELITANIPQDQIGLSGIELVDKYEATNKQNIFVKNGFECIPYVSEVFSQKVTYLRFYAELYNAAKTLGPLNDLIIQFFIEQNNTGKPIKEFRSSQKQKALNSNVVYKEINISKLPSGNYYLVIEVRDSQNKIVLETRKFIQRINNTETFLHNDTFVQDIQNTFVARISNRDTLAFYIKSLQPISDLGETRFIDTQLKTANAKVMQQFFFSFWKSRNESNPEMAWNNYRTKLDIVEKNYSTANKKGFETDRGRVYLQYGPPSSFITENNEANAYPYEIWYYYEIADQTDKKFIFYNKTMPDNDFKLLNSTVKGEINHPQWENELYSRSGKFSDTRKSKARELFDQK